MNQRVAVVTGAGSGIGAEIAAALSGAGYRVALAGRRAEALIATAERCPDALVAPSDVSDPGSVRSLFDAVCDRWGRVDLLVNNAGVFGSPAPVEEYSVEEWRKILDINLTGSFLCARQADGSVLAEPMMDVRCVVDGVLYMAGLPLDANVEFLTVRATQMPFAGRG